jgi:hypothetical protein
MLQNTYTAFVNAVLTVRCNLFPKRCIHRKIFSPFTSAKIRNHLNTETQRPQRFFHAVSSLRGIKVTTSSLEVTTFDLKVTVSGLKVTTFSLKVTVSGLKVTTFDLKVTVFSLPTTV